MLHAGRGGEGVLPGPTTIPDEDEDYRQKLEAVVN